jgi:DNA-binding protein H-NS
MFGKTDLVDNLSRDLDRVRDKRDALASHVTTLTTQITELEARLSAENDRRERERAVGEIELIKKQLTDHYLVFAPAIAGMCGATESARAIVPETRDLNNSLMVVATEVANAIDALLADLDRRMEALRAGHAPPQLSQSLSGSEELAQDNDRVLRHPEWLPRRMLTNKESSEDRCSTAA